MKLSVSNIAWSAEKDAFMYAELKSRGFCGVEIAPTRLIPDSPYEHTDEFSGIAADLKSRCGLSVASVQSIWYKRSERLFGDEGERRFLLDYTKKAIVLARVCGCSNIVFGSPKNRIIPNGERLENVMPFFDELGTFAFDNGVFLSIEAVPELYGTNCINKTAEAIAFVKAVGNPGLRVNLDIGTMISNGESADIINGNIEYINHVHISEPKLECIKPRSLHGEVIRFLHAGDYDGYLSIEMKLQDDINDVLTTADYLSGLAGAL